MSQPCHLPPLPPFPHSRPRRLRRAAWSRRLVAEHCLRPADLILPVFVMDGSDCEVSIGAMPGVVRHSPDRVLRVAERALEAGIPALALFPATPLEAKTEDGRRPGTRRTSSAARSGCSSASSRSSA